jgi:hypothetical protein
MPTGHGRGARARWELVDTYSDWDDIIGGRP